MAHPIRLDIPLSLQCLRIPVDWSYEWIPWNEYLFGKLLKKGEYWFSGKINPDGEVTTYDPWELRDEFFRLPDYSSSFQNPDLPDRLVTLLNKVGLFFKVDFHDVDVTGIIPKRYSFQFEGQAISVGEEPLRDLWDIYGQSLSFKDALAKGLTGDMNRDYLLQTTFLPDDDPPKAVIRPHVFYEALVATSLIDVMRGAEFQLCKRPDCAIPFPVHGMRKRKFCSWYCGHLESMRRKRKEAAKKSKRGK